MSTTHGRTSQLSRPEKVSIELRDWKITHRGLSIDQRAAVHDYIVAIIGRDLLYRDAAPEEQQRFADSLWRHFRDRYDELRHGDREDFFRAMGAI